MENNKDIREQRSQEHMTCRTLLFSMKPNTQYRTAFKSKFQDDFDVIASNGMLYTSIKVMILGMGSGAMT